ARWEAKERAAEVTLLAGFRRRARLAPFEIARDARRLRAVAREHRVDVLHTHHSHDHWLALLARPRSPWRRLPIVRTFHALRAVKRDPVSRRLYARTGAALAVSRGIEARCHDVGFAPERVYWTPGMADLPRFAAEADGRTVRDEFALGEAPVVVSVARLAPGRDHGRPPVLAAADCFALMAPGSDDSCRAALEAMAAARPVVARALGALPETIVHGETGLLLEDDRPEAVAAALREVLADRARARAMGAAGRRAGEEGFRRAG